MYEWTCSLVRCYCQGRHLCPGGRLCPDGRLCPGGRLRSGPLLPAACIYMYVYVLGKQSLLAVVMYNRRFMWAPCS